MQQAIARVPKISVDTETDGLYGKLVLTSVCDGHTNYVCTPGIVPKPPKSVKVVMHNSRYDLEILAPFVDLAGNYRDTLLADYIADPDQRQHGLKQCAQRWLHVKRQTMTELFGGEYSASALFDGDPTVRDVLIRYSAADAEDTFRLDDVLKLHLEDMGYFNVYEQVDVPFDRLLAKMQRVGCLVDRAFLTKLNSLLYRDILRLRYVFRQHCGLPDLNLNSDTQLADLFFGSQRDGGYGLPVLLRTKSGKPSLTAKILQQIRDSGLDDVDLLLRYRKLAKLRSTFVLGMLEKLDENDHLHTELRMTSLGEGGEGGGTATGRLSSRNPNLQNIPLQNADDPWTVRQAWIAPPGHLLCVADYNQIELRLLAHFSRDRTMLTAFRTGRDLHAITAKAAYGLKCAEAAVKDKYPQQRKYAKAINFGISYGMGPKTLAGRIKTTEEQAKQFIERFFNTYPGVRAWKQRTIEEARQDRYVSTLTGRIRYVHQIVSQDFKERNHAENQAINTPIQGSASEIIKMAMLDLARKGYALWLQVHDELLVPVPQKGAEEARRDIEFTMANAVKSYGKLRPELANGLLVKTPVDAKLARNWAEGK